jgi:hypothetical protein
MFIYFPASPRAEGEIAPVAQLRSEAARTMSGVVLVVEDQDEVRAQIVEALTEMGCEVRDRSKMPPMMQAADVVAASLAALAHAEVICIPGLDDASLLERLADVQRTVLMSANRPALSQRYRSSVEAIRPAAGER